MKPVHFVSNSHSVHTGGIAQRVVGTFDIGDDVGAVGLAVAERGLDGEVGGLVKGREGIKVGRSEDEPGGRVTGFICLNAVCRFCLARIEGDEVPEEGQYSGALLITERSEAAQPPKPTH